MSGEGPNETAEPAFNNDERIAAAVATAQWLAEQGFGIVEAYAPTPDGDCTCPRTSGTRGDDGRCKSPGKHPVGNDWQKRATRSAHEVEQRVRRHDGQYGVIPWPGEGGLILDIDHPAALAERLSGSFAVSTSAGRGHRYYRLPAGVAAARLPAKAAWGEIRVEGASRHVIGPWGRHAGGATYVPHGNSIDELPSEVLERIMPLDERPPAPLPGQPIVAGARDDTLASLAGRARRQGFGEPAILAMLREENARCVDKDGRPAPMSERELGRIAHSVARYAPEPDLDLRSDVPADPSTFPSFEDRGKAVLSDLGDVEYVEDLVRPGRLITWAAEEGTGKTYAVDGELGIRLAVAGGEFAGTWPIVRTGPVVYLSEMHPDDDFTYEAAVLSSLGLGREQLAGRYFRLPLATAAAGKPPLTVEAWRLWFVEECRQRGVLLAIFDTATGATQVDPWGRDMHDVFAGLRAMLEAYPALAVILVIHLKKPQGRGERRISDLLGEWGRWCDVVVLQESDGQGRTKLSTLKRVRRHRRIVVTKAGGLLIDPIDLDEAPASKVPADAVVAAIRATPGMTYAELGHALEVSKDTAQRYVKTLANRVVVRLDGQRHRLYTEEETAAPPQAAAQAQYGGDAADGDDGEGTDRRTPHALDSAAVGAAAVDLVAAATSIFGDDLRPPAVPTDFSAMPHGPPDR